MARSTKQLKHDAAEKYNVSNGNENSCVQQKVFFFVSGLVKSKKILNGKRSFFAKETDVDLYFPVIYYRRVISNRWFS